jgi:hypothetical protein
MTQMKLSNRAAASIAVTSPLNRILGETIPLLRHPIHNPKGALNLGIAHNDLMAAEMFEKVLKRIKHERESLNIAIE